MISMQVRNSMKIACDGDGGNDNDNNTIGVCVSMHVFPTGFHPHEEKKNECTLLWLLISTYTIIITLPTMCVYMYGILCQLKENRMN